MNTDTPVILNTTLADLPKIYWLFEEAIAYQTRHGFPVWRGYDKEVLNLDIAHSRQYKIMLQDDIACIFTVLDQDPAIWRERETGDAIYLHRIVVNPNFRGQQLFQQVFNWSIDHARAKNKKFIRMDTWADNPKIISYYQGFGFRFIENFVTGCSTELASQNRNLNIALLELPL